MCVTNAHTCSASPGDVEDKLTPRQEPQGEESQRRESPTIPIHPHNAHVGNTPVIATIPSYHNQAPPAVAQSYPQQYRYCEQIHFVLYVWGTRYSSPLDSSLGFGDRFLGANFTYSYEVLNSVYHPLIFSYWYKSGIPRNQ